MKEFLVVLSYTFKENLKKKAFIISTVIMLVLTIVAISLPGIITAFKSKGSSNESQPAKIEKKGTILLVDSKKLFTNELSEIEKVIPNYSFKVEDTNNIDTLKDSVSKSDDTSLMVVNEKDGTPNFDYYVKSYGKGLSPEDISNAFKKVYVSKVLKAANVNDQVSLAVQSDLACNVKELGKGMANSYISSIVVSLLLFFAIYYFGYGVSMSVASEKTSRVMELLVTSTKPAKIVLGKSVAMGLLGLGQMLTIMITGFVTYKIAFPKDFSMGGMKIDFSSFTPLAISMIVIYFILGYSLYAMMNAVAGATVSKAEDVNSAIMPISMISIISFYFGYFTLMAPKGTIAVVASIIPFSAAFSMPCRILASEVPTWQILASLASVIVTTVLIAMLSIKIYSSAVLHYGKRLKIKDLIKLSKTKA